MVPTITCMRYPLTALRPMGLSGGNLERLTDIKLSPHRAKETQADTD